MLLVVPSFNIINSVVFHASSQSELLAKCVKKDNCCKGSCQLKIVNTEKNTFKLNTTIDYQLDVVANQLDISIPVLSDQFTKINFPLFRIHSFLLIISHLRPPERN